MDKDLKILGRGPNNSRLYECPFCHDTIEVEDGVFYGQCPACKATIIDYKPAPHQESFHKSSAKFKLNIGGFGSGKTTMCVAEVAHHAMSVPGGRTLITAPILKQIKDAVLPELNKFLPPWLLERATLTPSPFYKLKNGHEIVVYASNDEQNLRSLNLTSFYVEEASNVDESIFTQLQTRLRNTAALIYDSEGNEIGDYYMGLVSTNPDECWVRDNFLLKSAHIYTSKSIDRSVYDLLKVKNPIESYASFLSSSRDNTFLPTHFIRDICAGKNPTWVNL